MLNIDNLNLERGRYRLAENISMRVAPGDIWLIEGPNGCGKSTLLATLAGLLPDRHGSIRSLQSSLKTIYIGHQSGLKSELTVVQNLTFWAGMREGHALLVPAALAFFGLGAVAELPVGKLSAGWQRKVALARLLASPALLWLLDEPFTHLDIEAQSRLEQLIATRAAQGGTVVMAAHGYGTHKCTNILKIIDYSSKAIA